MKKKIHLLLLNYFPLTTSNCREKKTHAHTTLSYFIVKSHRILIPSSVELTHQYLSPCEAFSNWKVCIYYVSSSPTIIEPEKVTWIHSFLISLMNESYHCQTVFKDDLNEGSKEKKSNRNSIQIQKFIFNQNDWFTREEKMFFSWLWIKHVFLTCYAFFYNTQEHSN